jgi:hypothetical protein
LIILCFDCSGPGGTALTLISFWWSWSSRTVEEVLVDKMVRAVCAVALVLVSLAALTRVAPVGAQDQVSGTWRVVATEPLVDLDNRDLAVVREHSATGEIEITMCNTNECKIIPIEDHR